MGTEETKKKDPHAELLASLRAKHGPVATFENPWDAGRLYAFRTPSIDEWEEFEESQKKNERLGPAKRSLCMLTLVHPEGDGAVDKLNAAFAKAPRLTTLIGDELMALAEGGIEVTIKKD